MSHKPALRRPTALAPDAGLTLLEVLAVLFLVGLATGLVVMTAPRTRSGLYEARAVLVKTLQQASAEAALTGVPSGLRFEADGASWWVWREGAWQATGERLEWPGGARPLNPPRAGRAPLDPTAPPHWIFDPQGLPAGEPIRLKLGSETLSLSPNGEILMGKDIRP